MGGFICCALAVSRVRPKRRKTGRLFGRCELASLKVRPLTAPGLCSRMHHPPLQRMSILSAAFPTSTALDVAINVALTRCTRPVALVCASIIDHVDQSLRLKGEYAMFVDRIKSPRRPKCGAMMSLRIIEPERSGFDSQTFECPKCYDTETFGASISREINDSIGPA